MMNKKLLFLTLTIITLLASPLFGASDYDIHSLHSEIEITETGVYKINESFTLEFHTPLHGFYRTLPIYYKFDDSEREDVKVRVSHIRSSDTPRTFYEGEYLILRLGSETKRVLGLQDYWISYNYDIGEDPHQGWDEFYFNIVGEGWEVPIESVTFTVTFPKPIPSDAIWFATGKWGSTSNESVEWHLFEDKRTISGKVKNVGSKEAVTLQVQLPDNYYKERTDYEKILTLPFYLCSLLLVVVAYIIWNRFGKDKELIIVPQFYPPENMSPMDVGYIIDGQLDPHDITSMIFYWADRGNLTIIEEKKGFSFIKGANPTNALAHETETFNEFFKCGNNGIVKSKDLEGKFFLSYQKMKKKIERYYRGKRALYSSKSKNMAALSSLLLPVNALFYALSLSANYLGNETLFLWIVGTFLSFVPLPIFHLMERRWHLFNKAKRGLMIISLAIVFLLSLLLLTQFSSNIISTLFLVVTNFTIALFSRITAQRSEYGQKIIEQLLGLRDFIERVEIEQLKRMIESDPDYYYRILSFAIVLGLEKKWAKKFSSITIKPPSWYAGSVTVWDALIVSRMLQRCNTSLLSSVRIPPRTSSPGGRFGGSSFGGGGFSGGGFGGGGGGAW